MPGGSLSLSLFSNIFFCHDFRITVEPDDEFIILGCDGIWDCLTNEQAVEFVRTRINDKKPTEIGVEMLDAIISDERKC